MNNRIETLGVISVVSNNHLKDYPTPMNLTYSWSFGSLAGLLLVLQIVTGVMVSMHYAPNTALAFWSIDHIMRDVSAGWILRSLHTNGASVIFTVVYIHLARGLYYGSYGKPRGLLWVSGIAMILLMMVTGFIGYVLPWGQMSLWGATVITSMVEVVPVVGDDILEWLWGGFSVSNATLNRFISLHIALPIVLAGVAVVHLVLLHESGSSNPVNVAPKVGMIGFYPYIYVKDLLAVFAVSIVAVWLAAIDADRLGHPDNYEAASLVKTPSHIVPEWYILMIYAMLRVVPHKAFGVALMLSAIGLLAALPMLGVGEMRSSTLRPLARYIFWVFIGSSITLGWLGPQKIEYPITETGIAATVVFIGYLVVILPGLGLAERYMYARSVSVKLTKVGLRGNEAVTVSKVSQAPSSLGSYRNMSSGPTGGNDGNGPYHSIWFDWSPTSIKGIALGDTANPGYEKMPGITSSSGKAARRKDLGMAEFQASGHAMIAALQPFTFQYSGDRTRVIGLQNKHVSAAKVLADGTAIGTKCVMFGGFLSSQYLGGPLVLDKMYIHLSVRWGLRSSVLRVYANVSDPYRTGKLTKDLMEPVFRPGSALYNGKQNHPGALFWYYDIQKLSFGSEEGIPKDNNRWP